MSTPELRRGSALARLFGAVVPLACVACGAPEIDKPPAPDMRQLVDDYEHPSATFDPSDAPELFAAIAVTDGLLAQTDLRTQLVDVLNEVIDQADDVSNEDGTIDTNGAIDLRIRADGYMRVTRICDGWELPRTPDVTANGSMQVTATFSRSGLDPIVWGAAAACRYRAGESRIELDQVNDSQDAVSVYWGESVQRRDLDERTLLADLNLSAQVDGERLALDFDFRSLSDGTIEYRLPQGNRALIARLDDADTVTVRAANGTFSCRAELQCRSSSVAGEP